MEGRENIQPVQLGLAVCSLYVLEVSVPQKAQETLTLIVVES
jgi:hypothetical protein